MKIINLQILFGFIYLCMHFQSYASYIIVKVVRDSKTELPIHVVQPSKNEFSKAIEVISSYSWPTVLSDFSKTQNNNDAIPIIGYGKKAHANEQIGVLPQKNDSIVLNLEGTVILKPREEIYLQQKLRSLVGKDITLVFIPDTLYSLGMLTSGLPIEFSYVTPKSMEQALTCGGIGTQLCQNNLFRYFHQFEENQKLLDFQYQINSLMIAHVVLGDYFLGTKSLDLITEYYSRKLNTLVAPIATLEKAITKIRAKAPDPHWIIDDTYDQYSKEIFTKFLDSFGFIIDSKIEITDLKEFKSNLNKYEFLNKYQNEAYFSPISKLVTIITLPKWNDILNHLVRFESRAHGENKGILYRGANGFRSDKLSITVPDSVMKNDDMKSLSFGMSLFGGLAHDFSATGGACALGYLSSDFFYAVTFPKTDPPVQYFHLPSLSIPISMLSAGELFHARTKAKSIKNARYAVDGLMTSVADFIKVNFPDEHEERDLFGFSQKLGNYLESNSTLLLRTSDGRTKLVSDQDTLQREFKDGLKKYNCQLAQDSEKASGCR